jgi:hypothetical protein
MLSIILEPPSRDVEYLEAVSIAAKLRNNFGEPISVQAIAGTLRYWMTTVERTMPFDIEVARPQIDPGAQSDIMLHVEPDPILPPWTVSL